MQFNMKNNQAEEGQSSVVKYSQVTTLFLLTPLHPFQMQAGSPEQWLPAVLTTQTDEILLDTKLLYMGVVFLINHP